MQKIQILKIVRVPSIQHQGVCLLSHMMFVGALLIQVLNVLLVT